MLKPGLSRIIEALSHPDAYPEPPAEITLVQTQMSCVFLAGEFVYKVKKPVNLGYVDYTELERRHYYCQREVELNRRLCPQAYLGVVPITNCSGNISIEGNGETVEYAVKMLRLPSDLMLDHLLREGTVSATQMEALAVKLADFHASAETSPAIETFGSVEAVRRNTEENFSQTERYFGRGLSEKQFLDIRAYTRRFIAEHSALFAGRAASGKIRDCHGDLQAAHICFCHELCIYDCIEFNERFRYGDVAGEVAFLAMDLDHYGRADLGASFIEAYTAASGDIGLGRLLNFYKCYRAYVRAKVNCFKLDDPLVSEDERQTSLANARGYFELSASYARAKPRLVITTGLVGSGKSTLAGELAGKLGMVHISSDITRKVLAGMSATEHCFTQPEDGIYSAEFTRRTYDSLFSQARHFLTGGVSVILDGAFLKRSERLRARMMAEEVGADFYVVECRISPELAQKRIVKRLGEVTASDGHWGIFLKQQEWFEPVNEVPSAQHIAIDASTELAQNIIEVLEKIK
jgi:hypothetical protein